MSITGAGSITAANVQAVNNMNQQLNTLSQELGTNEASQTYSGLGSQAGVALSLSGQLAALTGYSDTASTVGTTLTTAQSVLTQLGDQETAVQQSINQQGAFTLNSNGQTSIQAAAITQLDNILSLLNTQVGSNYIFSGSATTTPSVASTNTILNGNGAQAGLKQVIAERLQADQGAAVPPLGRLVIPPAAGSTVSIREDVAGSPFGFKLGAVNSSLTGATVTGPSGSPPTISVNLGAVNPNPGDSIAFNLNLPDGTSQTITLQATAASPPGANQFTVGATPAATATNLQAALTTAVQTLAQTALPAASAIAAANNFFNGETRVTSPNTVAAALGTAGVTASTQSTNDVTAAALAQLSALAPADYGDTFAFRLGNNPPVTATYGPALNLGTNTFNTAADLINVLNNGGSGNFAGQAVATTDGTGGVLLTSNDLVNNFAAVGGTAITSGDVAGANVTNTNLSRGSALTVSDGTNNSSFYWVANNASAADGTFSDIVSLMDAIDNPASSVQATITPSNSGGALELTNANGSIAVGGTIGAALGFSPGAVDDNVTPPLRVAGPPFDAATALVAGTAANTVFWYTGESSATPPRQTATAQVGPGISIAYGMRANEQAIGTLVANVAALAATTYSSANPNAQASYDTLSQDVTANLDPQSGVQQISDIEADLANAQTVMSNAGKLNTQTQSTLTDMMQSIDGVNQSQIGEQILTLQNSLSASLSVTARLAQVSLVNFLSPVSG